MAAAADSLAHSHSPLALTLNAPDRRQAGRRTCALCPLLRAVRPPAHRRRAGRFTGAAMAVGAAVAAAAQVSAGEHTCAHLCAKCVRLDVLARREAHTCANDIAALVSRARVTLCFEVQFPLPRTMPPLTNSLPAPPFYLSARTQWASNRCGSHPPSPPSGCSRLPAPPPRFDSPKRVGARSHGDDGSRTVRYRSAGASAYRATRAHLSLC